MNKFEAEKIINDYGSVIAKPKDPTTAVWRASWLSCSKAKTKQAYFVYIEAIYNDFGKLSEETGENLVACYSMLNVFVDDKQADELDKIKQKFKLHHGQLNEAKINNLISQEEWNKYMDYSQKMRDGELFDEINEFISDCLKR